MEVRINAELMRNKSGAVHDQRSDTNQLVAFALAEEQGRRLVDQQERDPHPDLQPVELMPWKV